MVSYGWLLLFLIPAACGYMAIRTGGYGWKVGVTGSCIVLLLLLTQGDIFAAGWALLVALFASLAGDYFLSHKENGGDFYLYGIAAFFVAHLFYIVYACGRFAWNAWVVVLGLLLLAGYGYYFFRMAVGHIPGKLRLAALAYCLISVVSMALSFGVQLPGFAKVLYILGILSIAFSDTMICETDFVGNAKWSFLILPTYYACHIAVSMAAVWGFLG